MIYRFGLFEFDPAAGELRKQGRVVRIEPQPARALALLLAHPGAVISREQLRAHVWEEGTHVDFDRGLAYCVGQVRTALGDSADNPRFVETLPRRGYRFIAPVQTEEAASERREAASAALIVDRQENAAAPSPVGGAATPPVAHGARWAVLLAILVAGVRGLDGLGAHGSGHDRWLPSRSSTTRPATWHSTGWPRRPRTSWSSG